MNSMDADYPFESFNARALSPRQVAIGFVPPDSFRKLCKRRHTVVAGPRGSGKTTLLKMLQVSALRSWKHPDAADIRAHIDFTGIFVPADRSWSEQISAIGKDHLSPEQAHVLGVCAFTTQVLRALVTAVMERAAAELSESTESNFRRISITPSQEVALSRAAAVAWSLQTESPTLAGLRFALSGRLAEVHRIASKCRLLKNSEKVNELLSQDFLHLNFLSAVPLFLDAFEEVTGLIDEKWALLFDELELAPESIRSSLTRALRSVDPRLLFKLAIAPFSRELEENDKAATDKNDFELVRLWYPAKEEGYPFSRSLMSQILSRRDFGEQTPEGVFGTTTLDANTPSRRSGSIDSYQWVETFERLAAADSTFSAYLRQKSINPRRAHLLSENERAATIRKITPLVLVREAFRASDSVRQAGAQRSRKASHLYCGLPALLAVSEGNPRWLIGLVDSMLDRVPSGSTVPAAIQHKEIDALLNRFGAFLRTIPCAGFDKGSRLSSVLGLIDTIGESFQHEIIVKPFNPDPIGTFIVDSHATAEQLQSLEQAVYAGAIVFVPESENEVAIGSLRGKRFRLAYLLAPKYKLPLVLLRAASMSALFNRHGDSQQGLFR